MSVRCGKRRVVLRKGHIGYNVYFIYSGSVNVIMEKDDTGVFIKPEVVVLRKGACFGVSDRNVTRSMFRDCLKTYIFVIYFNTLKLFKLCSLL